MYLLLRIVSLIQEMAYRKHMLTKKSTVTGVRILGGTSVQAMFRTAIDTHLKCLRSHEEVEQNPSHQECHAQEGFPWDSCVGWKMDLHGIVVKASLFLSSKE